jgi:hypothetical protein
VTPGPTDVSGTLEGPTARFKATARNDGTLDGDGVPLEAPLKERLEQLLHRILHPRPVVLDTRRPVEVPVITETKRLWSRGHRAEAVRYAYDAVLRDVQRAYHVEFPPDWTHEDILVRGVTREMGPIPDFLMQLLQLYEPVRYAANPPADLRSPVPLVESLYSPEPMWALYLAEMPHVPEPAASPDPTPANPPAVPAAPAATADAPRTGSTA